MSDQTTTSAGQPSALRRLLGKARILPVLALDALLIVASYAAALALKFDGDIPRVTMVFFGQVVILIVLTYIVGNYFFGVYRIAWQYAGLADAITLAFAVGLVSILLMGVDVFLNPRHIPLTVTLTAPPLILISMGVAKLWPRLSTQMSFFGPPGPVQSILIAGAGTTGQMLAREFLEHPEWGYKPLGFVDDDRRKQGTRIHGLPVLGTRFDIPALAAARHVDVVALAMPSATGATIRDFVGICQETGAAVRTVPGVPEIVHAGGAASLREITVEDLLARAPAGIDTAGCAAVLRGREILITGAAGYLGQELARSLLQFGPAVLHLLDTNESGLYEMQRDLKAEGIDARIWITDIVDRTRLERTFRAANPQVIFHTAAYKNIPVMEEHPEAAFHVNVVGTMNICLAADAIGAERVIIVSTNKAAELDSVYGATKRIGELLVVALGRESATQFSAIRLHNVMGSRGSVVPLFLRQIERGGPVQLSHADATRYFMSPPESIRLLIQAAALSQQGQVLVLDLGEEVKIADLAEKLIRLRGYQPGKDIQIVYSGLRPGEQAREDPLERRGHFGQTQHPQVFLAEQNVPVTSDEIVERVESLRRNPPEGRDELIAHLHALARIDLRDVNPASIVADSQQFRPLMKVATIVGARPQFVKAAAFGRVLRREHTEVLVHTGQHYDPTLSDVFFQELDLPKPSHHLGVGSGAQGRQTGQMLERLEQVLEKEAPDWVVIFGDANSTLAGALAAAKLHIPLAHVEAGLRSFDRSMPEEINRIVADHISDLLFAPTQTAMELLHKEGLAARSHLTGDIMYDSLLQQLPRAEETRIIERLALVPNSYVLATVHRAANTDDLGALGRILDALALLDELVVFPMHPRARLAIASSDLETFSNVRVIEPVGYLEMLSLQRNARLVLTDSGGVQKEAYLLAIPCVTLREETEWPETLALGWNVLAGSDPARITAAARRSKPTGTPPLVFGDGHSAERMVRLLGDDPSQRGCLP